MEKIEYTCNQLITPTEVTITIPEQSVFQDTALLAYELAWRLTAPDEEPSFQWHCPTLHLAKGFLFHLPISSIWKDGYFDYFCSQKRGLVIL